jgi:hypothetical protein
VGEIARVEEQAVTPLVRRSVTALGALLVAYAAAALLITVCLFVEREEILRASGVLSGWLAVRVFGWLVAKAALPALLVIALAERVRLRSVLVYAAAGGVGFTALAASLGGTGGEPGGVLAGRDMEIMAGAGITAGFVYWALAGRLAGAWQDAAEAGEERTRPRTDR